ncbi:GerAB/ArcD/ProY family transporter [Paenibacillus alginolyticus]|uniref:Spore germination protein n=1 Tax=Paenibacillus alginolyticus TaxID=59839 RepID=A0ABT4GFI5_9BACL|nr:endospore germination permease [Paenibacillus alginolyticus]MCY9694955.1 spore germination protein [Paenibacillus alginolyticus]MEC0143036.1 endospore germination permease [Paenibacillus alginolyticus]
MQRITQLQLTLMFILFHFSTTTGFLIGPISSSAGYQGWLAILLASIGGILITFLSFTLAKRKESEFIVHYGKELIGRVPNIIIMIVFGFFFLHLASLVLREISDFMVQIYLPTTPEWVIAGLFGLVVTIAVRSGLEAILRCASGFFFIIFGIVGITPFLIGKELNTERMIAFITHINPGSLFHESYPFIPWFGEMFLILFIFPWIANPQKTFRSLTWAMVISLFFIESNLVLCLLLFGSKLSGQLTYPVLEMIRFIRIGDFLENLDPIIVAVWLSSLFIKISVLLYIPTLIVSQLFKLKDARPLSFSLGAIMVGLSMHMFKNIIELNNFLIKTWPNFALCVECIPLIYLVASIIKKHPRKSG